MAFRTMVSSSTGTARLNERGALGSSKAICLSISWRSLPLMAGRNDSNS